MNLKKMSDQSLEEMQSQIAAELKSREEIISPIRFEADCNFGRGDGIGIVNADNQVLFIEDRIPYAVGEHYGLDVTQCKLVKVDVSELKVGYTYFQTNMNNWDGLRNIANLYSYCKYLGDGRYVAWCRECGGCSAKIGNLCRNHWYQWYQCVPVK
jgi:hypothetical protein